MELERGGLSEGEDCSAPGEDGGFRAYCLGTSSEPWSSGWGVYVCLCDRCIHRSYERARNSMCIVFTFFQCSNTFIEVILLLCFDFVAQSHTPPRRAAAAAAPPPPRRPPQPRHQADCGYRAIRGRRKGAVRLGNGNESDSSAPTIRLATLIRGARTAAGGERARILGVGASTAASTPGDVLGSARGRHLICARAHLLRRAPQLATT